MKPEPSAARAIYQVLVDTSFAIVLTLILGLFGIVARATTFDDGLTADTDPFAKRIAFALTVPADGPEALVALASARERAGSGATVHLETDAGSAWLVGYFRGDAKNEFLGDVVRDAGLFSGRVHTGNGAGHVVSELIADPDRCLEVAGWLLPWMLSASGLSFLLVGLWGRRRRATPPENATGSIASRLAVGAAVGVAAFIGANLLTEVSRVIGLTQTEQGWVLALGRGSTWAFVMLILVAGIAAPLGEEMFFRGHVFRWLRANASRRTAYIVSSLLFASVHFNPSATLTYVFYAVIFAWAYERWQSVLVPMTAHALVNTASVVLLRLDT